MTTVTDADLPPDEAEAFGEAFRAIQSESYGCDKIECVFPMDGNCVCFNTAFARHREQAEQRVERDADGKVMICTGCETTSTVAWIRATHPTAFTCCPERKMVRAVSGEQAEQLGAEREREATVAWLLSDGARLDYEASGSQEYFAWWAADAIARGEHLRGEG